MDKRYDIYTAEIIDSDIQWLASDTQHVEDTINAAPGWWKESPADGVNIRLYLNSTGLQQVLARSISVNLRSDRYTVQNPLIEFDADGTLVIYPNATLL